MRPYRDSDPYQSYSWADQNRRYSEEQEEADRAEEWQDLLSRALTIYRTAFFAAVGDEDDRGNAAYIALSSVYPDDSLDLCEDICPIIHGEWAAFLAKEAA